MENKIAWKCINIGKIFHTNKDCKLAIVVFILTSWFLKKKFQNRFFFSNVICAKTRLCAPRPFQAYDCMRPRPYAQESVWTCNKLHTQMKFLATRFSYIIVCVWLRYVALLSTLKTTFPLISLFDDVTKNFYFFGLCG